jgi:hypothetical protein
MPKGEVVELDQYVFIVRKRLGKLLKTMTGDRH